MAGKVRMSHDLGVGGRWLAGLDAIQEIPGMRLNVQSGLLLRELGEFILKRHGMHLDATTISHFDPTFVAFESDWASTQMLDPTRSLPKWRLQKVDDQLDSVFIPSSDVCAAGFELDGQSIVSMVGPLT
jgi:hypothetical protein